MSVTIPSVSPGTPEHLRGLRSFLRSANAHSECTSIDPEKGELRVFVKHGSLTLSITVRNDAYEYCAEQLLNLAF